jgi:hypothetical protein
MISQEPTDAERAAAGREMLENLGEDVERGAPPREREPVEPPEAPLPVEAPRPAAAEPRIRIYWPEGKPPLKLFAALAAVQEQDIDAPHDAKHAQRNRGYTSAEAILYAWKAAIKGTGLAVFGSAPRINGPRSANGPMWMKRECFLIHAPSGEAIEVHIEWPLNLHRGNTHEDALKAAMTSSLAWLLRDWGLFPKREEEPEPRRAPPQAPPPGPAPTPPPGGKRPEQSAPDKGTFASANVIGAMKESAKAAGITMVADMKGFMRDLLGYEVGAVDQVTDAEAKKVIAALKALPPKAAAPAGAPPAAKP